MQSNHNVQCVNCGKKEFNPSIPKGRIIDLCNRSKCAQNYNNTSFAFKDGNTMNINSSNMYEVPKELVNVSPINYNSLSSSEKKRIENVAQAFYLEHQKHFGDMQKFVNKNLLNDKPNQYYFRSRMFLLINKNHKNTIKYLKKAVELSEPKAKAELGYIKALGLYNEPVNYSYGIKLLHDALLSNDNIANRFAIDYLSSLYKGNSTQIAL